MNEKMLEIACIFINQTVAFYRERETLGMNSMLLAGKEMRQQDLSEMSQVSSR